MGQKFWADVSSKCENGAIAWCSSSPFDCLGPFAKVQNCPIIVDGAEVCRLTCYATDYADTWFSIPACTRKRGKYVRGYFTVTDTGPEFRVYDSCKCIFIQDGE